MTLEITRTRVDPDRWVMRINDLDVVPYDVNVGFIESFINDEQVLDNITYRRLVATLIKVINELNDEREAHQNDIQIIGRRMMEEATNRGWCSEYDTIVASLNDESDLSVKLPIRRVKQMIQMTVSWTGPRDQMLTRADMQRMIEEGTPLNFESHDDTEVESLD